MRLDRCAQAFDRKISFTHVKKLSLWIFLGVICLAGCANFDSACGSFTILRKATFGDIPAEQRLVTNENELISLWQKLGISPQPEPPEINFSKDNVVVIGMGEKPTGGYSVDIVAVKCEHDRTEIVYKYNEPPHWDPPDDPGNIPTVTNESSFPYVIARIAKPVGKIVFIEAK